MNRFKGMVDVCTGKMNLKQLNEEIFHYMYIKNPTQLIIDIQRKSDGFHATLWMSVADFKKFVWRG